MAKEQIEVDANGLEQTKKVFKTLENYISRFYKQLNNFESKRDALAGLNKNSVVSNSSVSSAKNPSPRLPTKDIIIEYKSPLGLHDFPSPWVSNLKTTPPWEYDFDKILKNNGSGKTEDTSSKVYSENLKKVNDFAQKVIDAGFKITALSDYTQDLISSNRSSIDRVPISSFMNGRFIKGIFTAINVIDQAMPWLDLTSDMVDAINAKPGEERNKIIRRSIGSSIGKGLMAAIGAVLGFPEAGPAGSFAVAMTLIPIGDELGGWAGENINKYPGVVDVWLSKDGNIDKVKEQLKQNYEALGDLSNKVGDRLNEIGDRVRAFPNDVIESLNELPDKIIESVIPQWRNPFGFHLSSYSEGVPNGIQGLPSSNPQIEQNARLLPSSPGPTAVNVNLPVGAIQLTYQSNDVNIEEISTYVSNKIAIAIRQALNNRDGYVAQA
ncbi:hypothetical protein [Cohnella mopanensis]|uniref:hypothetical protein n=1 Tax=Cohnella mopanensis TaxID=2911966 RepID=UPI001EF95A08|nr:hypothetical protein [Cohnella mopanensis]